MKPRRRKSQFIKYMLTYMAVSIVTTLLIGVFLYVDNIRQARADTAASYGAILAGVSDKVDGQLSGIYDLAIILQARRATEEIRLLDPPIRPEAVSLLNTYSTELQPYNYTNGFFEELILYFGRAGLFVSAGDVGLYAEAYYDTKLAYPNMSYGQWRAALAKPQLMSATGVRDTHTGSTFVDIRQDLPYASDESKTTLIARIRAQRLIDGLEMLLPKGVVAVLCDDKGGLVYATAETRIDGAPADFTVLADGQRVRLDSGEHFVFQSEMQNIRWNYLLLVPTPLFFAEENRILTNIIMNLAAILAAGVILAVSFSFYNMIPLRRLVRSLGAQGDDKTPAGDNEYGALDHHIRSLVRNNQDLRDEITRRYEYGKVNFIDRLLKGTFTSPGERGTAAIYSGLVMEFHSYALAVFELVGYNSEIHAEFLDEMDMTSTVIADLLEKRVEPDVLVHKADFNRIALVFCLDRPADPDAIRGTVSDLIDEVLGEMKIQIRCAVSAGIEDPDLISATYYALVAQLQRTDARASGPILVLPARGAALESFFYPLEVENRLLNHLLSGSGEDAVSVVRSTLAQNRDEYHITVTCAVYLIVAMKCTFIRARNEIELTSPEDAVRFDHIVYTDKNADLDIQLERFREITELLCRSVNEKRNMKNTRLAESIRTFIEENYANDQLCLGMIASRFLLTENYLSYFFKNLTGENLSNVIESVRLNAAVRLLTEGGKSIKDIGGAVGYTNLNTFYKAFKRHYGISPKGYFDREHQQG